MSVSGEPQDPIQSIYKIIPNFDSVQLDSIFKLNYFVIKWELDDISKMLEFIIALMKENKSLGFMSSKTLKDLLNAYTLNDMMRGVSVRTNPTDKDQNQGVM